MDLSGPGCTKVYYIPCVDVVWLEPLAFQEELVISPTFHNFADPILHNNVVKDIFAWVYLVSTEEITNRMSLQIIEIGYNSSVMDRHWYSGNYLFNVDVGNWEEEEEQKTILCGGGGGGEAPHTHWHVCSEKPLKRMKKKVMTPKLRLVTSEFLIPHPRLKKKSPKSSPKILIILSQFYCRRPAHKSTSIFFPRYKLENSGFLSVFHLSY